MKKLMLTAAVAAMAGGAFADPLVYDYKASVTHMYVKLINVRQNAAFVYSGTAVPAGMVQVYQKYKKTASLTGFLVWDTDGATSPWLTRGLVNNANPRQPVPAGSSAQVYDHGRNRAFLVVKNTSANAEAGVDVIRPKILPAVLDAKWFDTRFTNDSQGNSSLSAGIAEGTLFVGGQLINSAYASSSAAWDATAGAGAGALVQGLMSNYAAVAPVRPKLDNSNLFGNPTTAAAAAAGTASYVSPNMYSDYLWTSCYLFGQYNGPQWSGKYRGSEGAINNVQPVFFRLPAAHYTGGGSVYHDTWMNHAGIGTSELTSSITGPICCGLSVAGQGGTVILNSLSGNMKGGIYICSDNGYIQANNVYEPFVVQMWEDQFISPAMVGAAAWNRTDTIGHTADVWVDGDVSQNTTDVAYGTWSIVRTTAFDRTTTTDRITDAEKVTWLERNQLLHATYNAGANAAASWRVDGAAGTEQAPAICTNADLERLNDTLKAAAVRVNANKADFVYVNTASRVKGVAVQDEIYDMTVNGRFFIPVLTPLFAHAYGLAGYGL